jgi:DNA-binding ferritin-like protein
MIKFFLDLQVQVKLYHWQTTIYSRHIASDEAYDRISKHSDKFVEAYFGKYGRTKINKTNDTIKLVNNSDKDIVHVLKNALGFLNNDIQKEIDMEKDSDLINIIDELKADIHQILYLFTMT